MIGKKIADLLEVKFTDLAASELVVICKAFTLYGVRFYHYRGSDGELRANIGDRFFVTISGMQKSFAKGSNTSRSFRVEVFDTHNTEYFESILVSDHGIDSHNDPELYLKGLIIRACGRVTNKIVKQELGVFDDE